VSAALVASVDAIADRRVEALTAALQRLGWKCQQADLDLAARTARIAFKHHTGRVVTLDADGLGRVSLTREQHSSCPVLVGRRGDRQRAERHVVEFIGRTRHSGIRSAMRSLADYLADNSGCDRALARAPLAGLLSSEVSS